MPRRFDTHGQAARWAAMTTAKVAACVLIFGTIRAFARGYDWTEMWPYVVIALLVWLVGSAAIYLYLFLAGGVLSRDERQHKNTLG